MYWEVLTVRLFDAHLVEIMAQPLRAKSLMYILVENQLDDLRGILIDYQVVYFSVPLIDAAFLLNTVAIGNFTTREVSLLRQLLQTGLHAHGSFDALTGSLPITDVVQQLVHVVVKSLLTLNGTPDLNF